ncbi:hypothetical protein ABZ801_16530 [Actinomadura sp. NPDC047616]|uniref:hypothetical protein n=1 Tax=Actinomadura sp. NPDC047616 TaxID=3155914 RepID=UPI0033FC57C3
MAERDTGTGTRAETGGGAGGSHGAHDRRRPIAVIVVTTLIGMLFAWSFLGALHRPEPRDVPVAVVVQGDAAAVAKAMRQRTEGAFEPKTYRDEGAARQALLEREVDAVFVPGPGGNRLLIASASGRMSSSILTQGFQAVSQASGRRLTVEDLRPLPRDDGNGISSMFFVITLTIPAIALAILLAVAAPWLPAWPRLAAVTAGAVVLGGANAWVAAGLTGSLTGAPWELWGIGAVLAFVISSVTAGALRLIGPPGAALTALLFVPIGVPAGGGPIGPHFVPEWYGAIGRLLPAAAGIDITRNTVYFDGNAVGGPYLVLAVWGLLGIVLLAVPAARRRGLGAAASPALSH